MAELPSDHLELIGTEWEDRDKREPGRVIQLVAVVPDLGDGWGGPVFNAVTIENRDGRRVGRKTVVGLHGLKARWRQRSSDSATASPGEDR